MANTAHGLRYPTGPDVPDVPLWNGRLADDVDKALMTFGVARRDASTLSGATGSIWLTDLVGWFAEGPITVGATGITITTAGIYDAYAWGRLSSTAGATALQLNLGVNGAVSTSAFAYAASASTNYTLATRLITSFTAGQVIQMGYNQATASTVTFHGGPTYNSLSVRRLT